MKKVGCEWQIQPFNQSYTNLHNLCSIDFLASTYLQMNLNCFDSPQALIRVYGTLFLYKNV